MPDEAKLTADSASTHKHGSDSRRFLRGTWTGCVCGYDPRDNQKLNEHFAEHGFREVDDHGHILTIAVER